MAIESFEDLPIGDRGAASEALVERGLQQCVRIDVGRHAIENLPREVGGDAGFLETTARAQAAVPACDQFVACDRSGGSFIVERTFAQQASDGGVDVIGSVAAAVQPGPELRFGQFAPGEERQARDVAGVGTTVQTG